MAEPDDPQYTKLPNGGPRVMPLPLVIPDAHRLPQPAPTPAPAPSFEKPAPRERLQPEPVAGEEPGFYILPRSMTPAELYRELFDDMPGTALRSFSQLNPDLDETLRAGTMIVLSDPNSQSCTYAESQLLAAAHEVKASLAPLTPEEANFMMRHAAEIAAFTGETSTWLGVSAAVMEEHLKRITTTLEKIEDLHQKHFIKHRNLRSPEFFAERQNLLKQLDDHLLGSKRLRALSNFDDYRKLKNALGISSRSLVHHWRKAGAPGDIPGYSQHVRLMSRAAAWMKTGGYIGIGIGGVSGILAIKDVCGNGDVQACRRAKFVEGGKFLGATAGGIWGGSKAASAALPICLFIGPPTGGIATVVCAGAVIGVGAYVGTTVGGLGGEWMGEVIYEGLLP